MPIAEDASTPAVVVGTGTGNLVTASFSPPAKSMLVALVAGEWSSTNGTAATVSDSTGGTWTVGASIEGASSDNGVAHIAYRYLTTAPGSMTVTAAFTNLSGGRHLAVRVVNGADPTQTTAAKATKSTTTTSTDATISITTTKAGSQVYGVSGEPFGAPSSYTPNAATTTLRFHNNSTDGTGSVTWKATNLTGTPGATTLGGTWGASVNTNTAAFEVLPESAVAVAAGLSGSGTLSDGLAAVLASASAALGGAGTLTATAVRSTGAALSGAGSLTAAATARPATPAGLSGSGTLTAAATPHVAAALSGAGTLTATRFAGPARAAALTGAGTLTATVTVRFAPLNGPVTGVFADDGVYRGVFVSHVGAV